jgi:membrane carboxypeptidase/penicillin-binding protein
MTLLYKQPLSSKISEWNLSDLAQTVDKAYILVYYLNKIYS